MEIKGVGGTIIVIVIIGIFTYLFVLGPEGYIKRKSMYDTIEKMNQEIAKLKQENETLKEEIKLLKTDPNAIEKRIREGLGMTKSGEQKYLFRYYDAPLQDTGLDTAAKPQSMVAVKGHFKVILFVVLLTVLGILVYFSYMKNPRKIKRSF